MNKHQAKLDRTLPQVSMARNAAELLNLAQEAGQLGLFEWRVRTAVVRLSPKLLSLYGLTEFDGRYESWLECLFQEDVHRVLHLIENSFAEGKRDWQADFRIIRRTDGALRWMEARNIVFYAGGNPTRVVGVSADVTDRKRGLVQLHAFRETLEERVKERTLQLEEREAKIRRLVDANIVGIFIWELEGQILEANDAFLQMVGYDREDLISGRLRWTDLTPPEWRERDERALAEVTRTGKAHPFEKEYFRKDGSRVPVLLGGALFEESRSEGVAFVVDLTETVTLKRAKAEIEQLNRELEQRVAERTAQLTQASEALREAQMEVAHANRVATMGQLSASIAHELKQPIAVAIGSAQAAFNWLGKQPPKLEEVRQALSRIVEAGTQATEFIERIRNLFKKRDPQKASFDINKAILDVVALTRREMTNNKVSVQTQFADGLPFIQGDRVQLQQVMLNLIINAVEAMTEMGEGSRRLLIGTRKEGSDGLLVTVQDSGPGLRPDSLDNLFDAFYTTKPDGMGMGLSICRSIVEAHGGRLSAGSHDGPGATFQFTLPTHGEGDSRSRQHEVAA